MNFSKLFNRCLNQVYKIIAITLVLLAVAISSLRLMLPYAENYRVNLQNYVNNNYQLNMVIGNVNAGWSTLGPSLVAQNVSLVQTEQASIFIDRIDFKIDFWRSIKARQFITSDFTLTGAKVFVDKVALEELADKTPTGKVGANNQQASKGQLKKNNLATLKRVSDLFLTQIEHFSLRSSDIIVKTAENVQRRIFIKQLAWKNLGDHHSAQGDIIFGNLSAKNLKLQLSLTGKSQASLAGNIYLAGNNLDITPWLGKVLKLAPDKISSSVNFKSWLSLKNGSAEKVNISLGENHIRWQYQNKKHQLSLAQGHIVGQFHHGLEHFQVSSTPLEFILDKQKWPLITAQLSAQKDTIAAYLSAIELQKISSLVPLFTNDNAILKQLTQLSAAGTMHDIYLQKYADSYDLAAEFNDVNTRYTQGIPGVENLSGDILISGDRLQLTVKAKQGKLDFKQHFPRPLPYQYLSAVFNGKFSQSYWHIGSKNIIFKSNELALNASLGLTIPEKGVAQLALFANVTDVDAKNAKYYYPTLLMGEDLVNYLEQGLQGGKITQAKVLFNGPLAKFPFTDHSGIFTVDAELTQGTFKFDPQWPAIEHFDANLNFTNNSMLITGRAGDLLGVDVSGVKAAIADLSGEQKLIINVDINNAAPDNISQLMAQSPLKNSIGKTLDYLTLKSAVNGKFSLTIPLQTPEQTVSKGEVYFKNNRLSLKAPQMNFNKVNGILSFNNDKINIENLSLNWLNMPLSLTVNAENKAGYYQTDIAIKANWAESQWQTQVPKLLQQYAHGKLNWQGDLKLFIPENGDFSYQLAINSDLNDLAFNLPAPYNKKSTKVLPLFAQVKGDAQQSSIDVKMGDNLSFYGMLTHGTNENAHFSRAQLVLGNEKMLLPMEGFHITTNIAQANFSEWQPIISNIITSIEQGSSKQTSSQQLTALTKSKASVPLLKVPERIRGNIKQLDFYGEKFSEVSFTLFDKPAWWLLQVNAKEVRSQIKIYPNWRENGLDIDADFLHLSSWKSSEKLVKNTDKVDGVIDAKVASKQLSRTVDDNALFANFPAMKVHCDDCSIDKIDLGKVDFTISREKDDTLTLNNFVAKRGKSKLTFDASWLYNGKQSTTQLLGELKVKDIAHEFEQLGYASAVKGSGGNIKFNLNWLNEPQNFSLASLNGDLSARVDDGYLVEVSDKARIFSVLSLNSLVRKLTLDFRDIFSKGMFYNYIKGDFHLKNGIIYTQNMRMKGAAGDLVMKGNTDLTVGKLDYKATYTTNVTSSLPAIAWIATLNPVTFLAGIAIDKVITAAVPYKLKFELTGTVEEPLWREVDRKTRDITVGRSTPPTFVDNLQNSDVSESRIKDITLNKSISTTDENVIKNKKNISTKAGKDHG